MCGIAGFIAAGTKDLEAVCRNMTRALEHRGPDDSGHWTQPEIGLAIGHRRLSIVDLSAAGHQPMTSAGGRYEIVFNGEIYNHASIRAEIEGGQHAVAWRGHSDTETLLAAVERWGIQTALHRCVGMFAIAIWDKARRVLTLVRDRAGEKPLYYGQSGGAFMFGSELKALQAHPAFRAEVDRASLTLFLRYAYVPEPRSIFQGIGKLLPGTMLEVDASGRYGAPVPYWTAAAISTATRSPLFSGTDTEAIDALEGVLGEAVAAQMVADVPIGAFLSGGVDSSLIVALMQKQSSRKVRTFTIGFSEPEYDESGHARAVAAHLGTDHTELVVTPRETMDVIPRLPLIYDEPFGDASQIPTFLVSKLAREHVTVSLSGDAGDELFGGYNRYTWARRLWGTLRYVPEPLSRLFALCIRSQSPESLTRTLQRAEPLLPRRWRAKLVGDKLHKVADVMGSSRQELYRGLVSNWRSPAELVVGAAEPASRLAEIMAESSGRSFEEDMMYWDLMTYLPGDILVKVDRAAMAVALETRVPMLDHRVVEFAWGLPLDLRIRNGQGKWLLKSLLSRYVPRTLTERPKTGFGIPIGQWLRGPLRGWAETLLDESRLRREGFFAPAPIHEKWREHVSGSRNWAYWLWNVLMFQAWWQEQCEQKSGKGFAAHAVA